MRSVCCGLALSVVDDENFDRQPAGDRVSVSNSSLGSGRQLDEAPTMNPRHVIERGRRHRVFADEGQRRPTFQGVAADRVVVGLELGELPLQVTGVPLRLAVPFDAWEKSTPESMQ